jgi:CMP-N-acetylneuraminic acid synthetase
MKDLDDCFSMIDKRAEALSIFSVSFPKHNPYSDMVEPDDQGFAKVCKDKGAFLSRQTSPRVYELNASFYFFRRKFFEENHPTQISDKSLAFPVDHICFEIDDMVDMDFLDFLITQKKLDFEFPLPNVQK